MQALGLGGGGDASKGWRIGELGEGVNDWDSGLGRVEVDGIGEVCLGLGRVGVDGIGEV